MLEQVKRALVDSFIAAIALGWLFAQAILHFAYIFAAPVASWISRKQYPGVAGLTTMPTEFYIQEAVPELIKSFVLLLLGYLLLRWLYLKPTKVEVAAQSDPAIPS